MSAMPATHTVEIAASTNGRMIRVQVANTEVYERWLTTWLMGDPAIARVDSRITMKLIKKRA